MEKRYYYLVAFTAFLLSLIFDNDIVRIMAENRTPILTVFFGALTWVGTLIFIPFLIISYYFLKTRRKHLIIPLWVSLGLSLALAYLLKFSVRNSRPEQALGIKAAISETGYAFPSAHATAAFSALPLLESNLKNLSWLLHVLAFLIAFSRVYLGVHYLSDVIAGAIIGYGISDFIACNLNNKYLKKINFLAR